MKRLLNSRFTFCIFIILFSPLSENNITRISYKFYAQMAPFNVCVITWISRFRKQKTLKLSPFKKNRTLYSTRAQRYCFITGIDDGLLICISFFFFFAPTRVNLRLNCKIQKHVFQYSLSLSLSLWTTKKNPKNLNLY